MKPIKNILLKNSLIVAGFGFLASFLNYLYHPIMANYLTPSQLGLFESLIALTYLTAVISESFSLTLTNFFVSLKNNTLRSTLKSLQHKILLPALIVWLSLNAFYPLINHFLHLNSFLLYFTLTCLVFLGLLTTLYTSALTAKLKFFPLSFITLLSTVIKILFGLYLLRLGLSVLGSLLALIISSLSLIIIGRMTIDRLFPHTPTKVDFSFSKLAPYSINSFLVSLSLAALFTADVLLARFFFPPDLVGFYASASVIAKIIIFFTGPVIMVAFPLWSKTKKQFLPALTLTGLATAIGLTVYLLFPKQIITLLYPPAYLPATVFLPLLAVFLSLLTLFSLIIKFLLAQHQPSAGFIGLGTAVCQITLIAFFHPDLLTIIKLSILSLFLGLLFSLYHVIKLINVKIS